MIFIIRGIGTDIISINRIKELKNIEQFARKILSNQEFALYQSFVSDVRQTEFLAGRWAAKEAVYKALQSTEMTLKYHDVVILNDEHGAPYFENPVLQHLHISISHCREYATAFVIYEV